MIVLLICVVLTGCSNSKRDSADRLAGQIDKASRLFDHATALLANPPKPPGADKSTGSETEDKDVDVPEPRPVDNTQVEAKLAQAEKILVEALPANPDAPLATRAEALHLLGQIHLAAGKHHATAAERLRRKADSIRMQTHNALALARSNTIQARFGTKLANLPKDKVIALRDEQVKQLAVLNSAIANIDDKIAVKTNDNDILIKENEALLLRSRSLRDQSEVIGGPKGLELLKDAQTIESKVNSKISRISANQKEIAVLMFDKARLGQNVRDTGVKLATIRKRLEETDQFALSTMKDVKITQRQATRQQKKAEECAAQVVECCKDIAGQEKLAIDALDKAGTRLGEAQKTLRSRINAAKAEMTESGKTNEMLQSSSNEGRLVIIITARASSSLALGDLRRRQLAGDKANVALVDAIEPQSTTLADGLKGYLADANKTRNLAEENYKQAENQLEEIMKLRLKGDMRNTMWLSQAMLADAYLGHYELTGQKDILDQARQFVDEALADKKASPYLKRVVELQQLIQSAGL